MAIATPFGLFEFIHMPLWTRNAPQTFQRFMDNVLCNLPFAYAYLNDLLIASSSPAEHLSHVCTVLERLQRHSLTINAAKSEFGKPKLQFIGHEVLAAGIRPLPEKVETAILYPPPLQQTFTVCASF